MLQQSLVLFMERRRVQPSAAATTRWRKRKVLQNIQDTQEVDKIINILENIIFIEI